MKPEWVEYTGSDEQIAEIAHSKDGTVLIKNGEHLVIKSGYLLFNVREFLIDVTEYLICQPHPYAKEIKQWAETGQPVYWCSKTSGGSGECHEYFPPFAHPDMFEYSFTPFEGEL